MTDQCRVISNNLAWISQNCWDLGATVITTALPETKARLVALLSVGLAAYAARLDSKLREQRPTWKMIELKSPISCPWRWWSWIIFSCILYFNFCGTIRGIPTALKCFLYIWWCLIKTPCVWWFLLKNLQMTSISFSGEHLWVWFYQLKP